VVESELSFAKVEAKDLSIINLVKNAMSKMEQENLDQMSDVNEPVEEKYYDPDEYRDNEEDR
jgi:hypothetical protein